jgi:hypothetical protein
VVAERLGRGGARGESASGEGAEAPPRSVAGWATAEAPPAPTTSRSMLSTRGQAAAGERLPTLEARSRSAQHGSRTNGSASWIEDERAGLRRAGESWREEAVGLNVRAGWACCILQLPLRQLLEPLQWLQDLRIPDAARVAKTAGDSFRSLMLCLLIFMLVHH